MLENTLIRFQGFKGLLHPKIKILSLIIHPHVVPNPQVTSSAILESIKMHTHAFP